MFENPDLTRFIYIIIACAVVMGALWYFVIAPMERRNHDRKLANLQERIKKHEEHIQDPDAAETQQDD